MVKKKLTNKCEVDHVDLRIRLVTITNYINFASAFSEAAKHIKPDDTLWDVRVNRSAAGFKLLLYFLQSVDDANDIPKRRFEKVREHYKG